MAAIHSERLLIATGDLGATWTVPVGKRAAVKSISVTNGTAAAGLFQVWANGLHLFAVSVPGSSSASRDGCTAVLYAGEQLAALGPPGATVTQISGFLFGDLTGRTAAPGETVDGVPPELFDISRQGR